MTQLQIKVGTIEIN